MLGPLEVIDAGRPVTLRGIRQRATLGFLLLHANRVVATSQLLHALWIDDDAPVSARKILQNAIWGLRGVLSSTEGSRHSPQLLTQAPGYVLRVDPDHVDLTHFHRLVEQGRAELAGGSPELARATLDEALALWRGPVLADLVETGISWPELTSVQNAQLDAMEDYFEAELACGRHQVVLGELDKMVETNALRERCCGQLMLALYRSGRQADALNVYGRVRRALVEQLGLEPGRELQTLQSAILNHDPELSFLPPQSPPRSVTVATNPQDRIADIAEPDPDDQDSHAEPDLQPGATPDLAAASTPRPRMVKAERKHISALMVHNQLAPASAGGDPAQIDELRESVAATVRACVECSGGTLAASIGSVSLALFGVPHGTDDAGRAVRAALMVRDCLTASMGASAGIAKAEVTLSVQVAVASGEALLRYQPDDNSSPPSVTGALLDECQALLSSVPDGEIRVCDRTRAGTASLIAYDQVGAPAAGWQVSGTRQEPAAHHALPIIDRDCELDLLLGLLGRVRHRSRSHLVTVLGEPGIGKTRIVVELERRVAGQPDSAQFLVGRTRPDAYRGGLAVPTEILTSYCGIQHNDSFDQARAKLGTAVERVVRADDQRDWLLTRLSSLLDPLSAASGRFSTAELLDAWRQLIEQIALRRPLVLAIDDVHLAEDTLLDLLEQLAGSAMPVPLLLMVTARPELHQRRPEWGGGQIHGATITLDPLSDSAIDRLLEFLSSTGELETSDSSAGLLTTLLADAEEDVSLHHKRTYVRMLLASHSSPDALTRPARMGVRAHTSPAALKLLRRPEEPKSDHVHGGMSPQRHPGLSVVRTKLRT